MSEKFFTSSGLLNKVVEKRKCRIFWVEIDEVFKKLFMS
jgi:hypothetical protein